MKRAIALSFLMACAGVLLGDSPDSRSPSRESPSLLQDLVRMTNGGFSDETVLAYARAHRTELPPEVSADDLLWLRRSGVGEPVIRYMAAIDVRATDGAAGEDVGDDADNGDENARYSAAADSDSDRDYGYDRDNDYGYDRDNDYGAYADSDYGSYPETYYNDYYPFYGLGYYPYPAYFFVSNSGFFGRFRGRGHGFRGHRGRVIGRGGFGRARSMRGDFDRGLWRNRGSVGPGRRGPVRPTFSRANPGQGFRGPRGGVIGRGAPAQRAFSRGGFGQGPRVPRGAVVRNGGFGRPGFAGGGHAGGGFGRGPAARSGGSRGAVGGRGRR
jgi:hypothetical protein